MLPAASLPPLHQRNLWLLIHSTEACMYAL
jgi:hypothetical protein